MCDLPIETNEKKTDHLPFDSCCKYNTLDTQEASKFAGSDMVSEPSIGKRPSPSVMA